MGPPMLQETQVTAHLAGESGSCLWRVAGCDAHSRCLRAAKSGDLACWLFSASWSAVADWRGARGGLVVSCEDLLPSRLTLERNGCAFPAWPAYKNVQTAGFPGSPIGTNLGCRGSPVARERRKRPLVLLVDADHRTSIRFAQLLCEDGFEVEIATDGDLAIERIAQGTVPDAIVTELFLPNAGGEAVMQFARSRRSDVAVFFVTNHPQLVPEFDPSVSVGSPPRVFTKPVNYREFQLALCDAVGCKPLDPCPAPSNSRRRQPRDTLPK